MLNELFQATIRTAGLTAEEITELEAALKAEDQTVSEALKAKLKAANDGLTSREFLRNDPAFLESVRNEQIADTLNKMDAKNREDWIETFKDVLTPEEIEAIYSDKELKYSSSKERRVRQLLKEKISGTTGKLQQELEQLRKNAGNGSQTIEQQSARIRELEAAIEKANEEKEAELAKIQSEYRTKEVRQILKGRIDQIRKQKPFISEAPGYLEALERNAFMDLSEKYDLRPNDRLEIQLFQKADPTLQAVDPDTQTILGFNSVVDKWLENYGALTRNQGGSGAGGNGGTGGGNGNGGAPAGGGAPSGGEMPKGVDPNSEQGKRIAYLKSLQQR